jgi:hypothetical protein
MILDKNHVPNVTCPFCKKETMPSHELEWTGWELAIEQTCPECDKRWTEVWNLSARAMTDDDDNDAAAAQPKHWLVRLADEGPSCVVEADSPEDAIGEVVDVVPCDKEGNLLEPKE